MWEPQAIHYLERAFEATLTFYAVQAQTAARGQDWPARCLRTTGLLERTFSEFRAVTAWRSCFTPKPAPAL